MTANGIRAFWNWWLTELHGLVPSWIRRVCLRRGCRLIGMLNRTEFVLFAPSGRHRQQALRIAINASEPTRDLIAALEQIKRRHKVITLQLSQELGLRNLLNLPVAAREDLDGLLRYEIDRLSPFSQDDVYFAYRIISKKAEERRIRVQVDIVPRTAVNQAVSIAKLLGLQPRRIELAGGTEDTGLDLLPRQDIDNLLPYRFDLLLGVLAVATTVASVLLPLHQKYLTAAELEYESKIEKREAELSLMLRERIDNVTATMNFVFDHKKTKITTTHVLNELTRLIHDAAYVVKLRIYDGEVQIDGYAESISGVIGSLERSPLFSRTRFLSPITTDPHSGREHFQVAVEIRPTGS